MTGLIIHPKVAEELGDAAKWYREIDPELGLRFLSSHPNFQSRNSNVSFPLPLLTRHDFSPNLQSQIPNVPFITLLPAA